MSRMARKNDRADFQSLKAEVIKNIPDADSDANFRLTASDSVILSNIPSDWKASEKYTVIASGAARGGTTILSYMLTALGLEMGSGHGGEDRDFIEGRNDIKQLELLISQRNNTYERWGLKVPGFTSGHYAFFEKSVRNPIFIFIFRNPISTAKSVIKRAGPPFTEDRGGFGRALHGALTSYMEFSTFYRQTKSPAIMIEMESLKKNAASVIASIAEVLDLDVSDEILARIAENVSVSGYKNVKDIAKQ